MALAIEFTADALSEAACSFEDALAAARHRNAKIAKLTGGTTPAGDVDPYKGPHDVEGDETADDVSGGDMLENDEAFEVSFESSKNNQVGDVDET